MTQRKLINLHFYCQLARYTLSRILFTMVSPTGCVSVSKQNKPKNVDRFYEIFVVVRPRTWRDIVSTNPKQRMQLDKFCALICCAKNFDVYQNWQNYPSRDDSTHSILRGRLSRITKHFSLTFCPGALRGWQLALCLFPIWNSVLSKNHAAWDQNIIDQIQHYSGVWYCSSGHFTKCVRIWISVLKYCHSWLCR